MRCRHGGCSPPAGGATNSVALCPAQLMGNDQIYAGALICANERLGKQILPNQSSAAHIEALPCVRM